MIRIVLTLVVLFVVARFLLQFGIDTAWRTATCKGPHH